MTGVQTCALPILVAPHAPHEAGGGGSQSDDVHRSAVGDGLPHWVNGKGALWGTIGGGVALDQFTYSYKRFCMDTFYRFVIYFNIRCLRYRFGYGKYS